MANEINKLNIGGTEYPIYSEGVKLSSGGTKFLTTSGTSGNQTIGVSDAITGNVSGGITIKSNNDAIFYGGDTHIGNAGNTASMTYVYHGGNGGAVVIGDDADGSCITVGNPKVEIYSPTIHIGGNESDWIVDKILIGSDSNGIKEDLGLIGDWQNYWADREIIIGAADVHVGDCANTVSVGDSATNVSVGNSATNVSVGNSAATVTVGDSAANVTVGVRATNVNLGSISSNIEIGNAGIKFVSNKTGNIYNNEIHIGYATSAVSQVPNTIRLGTRKVLNSSSTGNNTYNTLYLGANILPIDNGTAYKGVSIGSSSYKIKDGYFYNLYYAGSCTKSSDERLKIFGDNLKVDFDALANIRKANYTWKDTEQYGSQNNIGVSAQELREVYPEFVVEDSETGLLSVDYSGLSVVALAAIDELHKENVELKSRLDKLEALLTKITEQ